MKTSETRIGHRNKIREFVTINRGTKGGRMVTSIGDDNLVMAYVHIAHDVTLTHHIILANSVTFAGHVQVASTPISAAIPASTSFAGLGGIP